MKNSENKSIKIKNTIEDKIKKLIFDIRKKELENEDGELNKKNEYNNVVNEWMRESVAVFKKSLKELFPDIKKHKYDVIIGEDISGRIPALIMGGLIKKVYEQDGVKKPPLLFLTGYRGNHHTTEKGFKKDVWDKKMKDYFEYLKENNTIKDNSKVLLITEYIDTGNTVKYFINCFKKNNINITIASLQTNFFGDSNYLKRKKVKIYNGEIDKECLPVLWDGIGLKGLKMFTKDFNNSNIFVKKSDDKKLIENYKNIKYIRNDIKEIIGILFDYYKNLLKNN